LLPESPVSRSHVGSDEVLFNGRINDEGVSIGKVGLTCHIQGEKRACYKLEL
jgi:hypothetical protein